MNSGGHFFWWASRLLAGVCLLLLVVTMALDREEQPLPAFEPNLGPATAAPTDSTPKVDLPRLATRPARTEPARASQHSPKQILPSEKPAVKHAQPSVAAVSPSPFAGPRSRLETAPTLSAAADPRSSGGEAAWSAAGSLSQPAPAVTTLKPLGYVERADGSVEAVVAEGDHVSIVREGDVYAGGYRVAEITPSLVRLVEDSPHATALVAAVEPPSETQREVASFQEAASKPAIPSAIQDVPRTKPPSRQKEPVTRVDRAAEPLKEAVAARAEPGQSLNGTEAESGEPGRGVAQGGEGGENPVVTTRSVRPMGYVEWAGGRMEAVVDHQGWVQVLGENERFERDYWARRVSPTSVEIVEERQPPLPARRVPAGGVGEEGSPGRDILVARAHSATSREAEGVVLLPGGELCPAGLGPRAPPACGLRQLGYLEQNDGQLLAIMADKDEVFLVGEGEVFARRFRAIRVSASWVDFVEERAEQTTQRASPMFHASEALDRRPRGLSALAQAPPTEAGGKVLPAATLNKRRHVGGEACPIEAARAAESGSELSADVSTAREAGLWPKVGTTGGTHPSSLPHAQAPSQAGSGFGHWALKQQELLAAGPPCRPHPGQGACLGGRHFDRMGVPAPRAAGNPAPRGVLAGGLVTGSCRVSSLPFGSSAAALARPPPHPGGISGARGSSLTADRGAGSGGKALPVGVPLAQASGDTG